MEKIKILVVTLFLLGAFFFLGKGLTGYYLIDFEQDACNSNSDCMADEVCCDFFEEGYGVCDVQERCGAISDVTRLEKQRLTTYPVEEIEMKQMLTKVASAQRMPVEKQKDYSFTVAFLLFGVVLMFLLWENTNKK